MIATLESVTPEALSAELRQWMTSARWFTGEPGAEIESDRAPSSLRSARTGSFVTTGRRRRSQCRAWLHRNEGPASPWTAPTTPTARPRLPAQFTGNDVAAHQLSPCAQFDPRRSDRGERKETHV